MVTKQRGGGAKGLSGRATKKRTFFCSFPYLMEELCTHCSSKLHRDDGDSWNHQHLEPK